MPRHFARSEKARSMLFDLYGDFADEGGRDGTLWLSAAVRLAADRAALSLTPRSAVHRLMQDGWLTAERQGRESLTALSPRARKLIAEGKRRIFAAPEAIPWDGTWCLVGVSVPEARREIRDRLRQRLSWLGFGTLANGRYVAARDHADDVVRIARELGAAAYVQVYRARAVWPADPQDLVRRAWSGLSAVDRRHRAFISRFLPRFRSDRARLRRGLLSGREAFRTRFGLAHAFRRTLSGDPDLPLELQPPGWQGPAARRLFLDHHRLVTRPALAYFDDLNAGRSERALRRAV